MQKSNNYVNNNYCIAFPYKQTYDLRADQHNFIHRFGANLMPISTDNHYHNVALKYKNVLLISHNITPKEDLYEFIIQIQ